MINTGKCPKCDQRLSSVKIETIDLIENINRSWKGTNYVCPNCSAILGVEMDPTAMRLAIVGDVRKMLSTR